MFVTKFLIHVTKFVTKTILYEPKNYLADIENYLADSKNYLADSGARNGLCRAQPRRSRKVRVYEPMSGQDKPVISDGFEVQTIHSQPV